MSLRNLPEVTLFCGRATVSTQVLRGSNKPPQQTQRPDFPIREKTHASCFPVTGTRLSDTSISLPFFLPYRLESRRKNIYLFGDSPRFRVKSAMMKVNEVKKPATRALLIHIENSTRRLPKPWRVWARAAGTPGRSPKQMRTPNAQQARQPGLRTVPSKTLS